MSSSVSEDQDQRSNTGLEDLTTMTIESLRARLLSERAISKAARQRADELAKRVVELEDQLKIVCLQRKRAEKATADVLAILESNGISDALEEFDSNSDEETTMSDSKVGNHTAKKKGASTDVEVRRHDIEAYSSSEFCDSSPSTRRSLSWKSGKDSPNYMKKKKFMDSGRRRSSSFASNSSLPKRVGKSCRRIRHRENRSVAEELKDDANMHDNHDKRVAACTQDLPNCPDIGPETARDDPAHHEAENQREGPSSGFSGNRVAEANFSGRNEQGKTMERALCNQAQKKEEDEAQEKAQKEWEENFRENNSSVLDSYDPGNRSDVTEEKEEMKAPVHRCPAGGINLNQGTELEVANTSFTEDHKPKVPNNLLAAPQVDTTDSQGPETSGMITCESRSSEFAFPMSNGTRGKLYLGDPDSRPSHSSYICLPSNRSPGKPFGHVPLSCANNGESSESRKDLALMPQNSSSNLDTVLVALQQAKLSLKDKLYNVPPSVGSSGKGTEPFVPVAKTRDEIEIPVGCPGIFKLPTDFPFGRNTKANYLGLDSAQRLSNHCSETAHNKLMSSPSVDAGSNVFVGDGLCTSSSPPFTEMRSGMHIGTSPSTERVSGIHTSAIPSTGNRSGIPTRRPVFEPPMEATFSGRTTYLDPHLSPGLPLSRNYTYPSYPVCPEMRPQPYSGERFSRNSSMEFGRPSAARFSCYDDHIRPNMYK